MTSPNSLLPAGNRTWSSDHGFGSIPQRRSAPEAHGLTVYRAWGGSSTEWGSGFFSLEKPTSVLDAELRFNIVDWGNAVRFVSTFRIGGGVPYYIGPVAHGVRDLSLSGTQIWISKQDLVNVQLIKHAELLSTDGHVVFNARDKKPTWN
jgi:hypothetical protein